MSENIPEHDDELDEPIVGATEDDLNDPHGLEAVEDFDQFWRERNRQGKRVRIMGEVVELPPSMPLQFELQAKRAAKSKKDDDVRKLVAILFGDDMVTAWAERGMDAEQFAVLLMWASVNVGGGEISMAEAADEYRNADKPDPTKRQKPSKKRSSGNS